MVASGARCYGVLAHGTGTGRHRKRRELTAMRMAGSAASGRAPKARVDGGGVWREKDGRRLGKSKRFKTESRNWGYLWTRGSMTELQEASATVIGLKNGGLKSSGESFSADRKRARWRGSGSGFVGGWHAVEGN